MNKASGGDGIPVELFQILKDDAVKVLHSICQHIWKTQQWPQDSKRSVFIPIVKKGNAKECSDYCTIALILHASKVMLKTLLARLQHQVNHEIPDAQLDLEKAEEFSSVPQSCPTFCKPMNHSTPGLPVHHKLPKFTQTHAQGVGDAIQPSHPLSSPPPPAPNSSQHQVLFQ